MTLRGEGETYCNGKEFGIAELQIHSWKTFIRIFLLYVTGWEELLIELLQCYSRQLKSVHLQCFHPRMEFDEVSTAS